MRAPDVTYRYLYPKDVSGPTFEILSRSFSSGATAAATITETLTGVPLDRILVLTNATIEGLPGAAQTIDEMVIQGTTQAGLTYNIAVARPLLAATEGATLNWAGEVYIQGGGAGSATIRLSCVFNAGVAANSLFASLSGIVIPRGNAGPF